ncbi:ankyrin [Aspergillus ruber CBS 135680]|uniref:Ankyrin n=1 Tax=Aspergillus ruber (strain CBS 135680) TaxID=1388766 RepID=A0A017S5D7_ASPRC|nr:ankyrin [Aspergillus ruber CBS 135680]EYE92157.1 ankyrin [Aspergillus ruber CBS 135680]
MGPVFPKFVRCKLSLAAYLYDESAVVSLVARGVGVNTNDKWLGPPPNAAVFGGHLSIVNLLLGLKADPNIPNGLDTIEDSDMKGGSPIMRLLLQNDEVNPNKTTFCSDRNAMIMVYHPGSSPLEAALLSPEHDRMAELLLQQKDALYTITDEVLLTASPRSRPPPFPTLRYKIKRGIYRGQTPFHAVIFNGHQSIVELLLEYKAAYRNSKDGYHRTPLLAAVWRGRAKIACLILQQPGIDITWIDCQGCTAASYSAQRGYLGILKAHTVLENVDKHGRTLLIWAARNEYTSF